MTALNFHISENQILVVADTLVTDNVGGPAFFTPKVHSIPHLQGLICGTGDLGLIVDWLAKVVGGMLARDLAVLDAFAPIELQNLYNQRIESFGIGGIMTIYHFGLDAVQGRLVGFAYRSTNGFLSEPLQNGLYVKPAYVIGDREMASIPG